MRHVATALALLALGTVAVAAPLPGEQTKAGFIFVKAGSPVIREAPDASSKSLGTPPAGGRLVYRRLIDPGSGPTWFYVEHPGGKAGWIAVGDTSPTRPNAPPPAKAIKVIDTGVGLAQPSSAQTAAARGLSPAAKSYAEKKQDWKASVDQFVTMEKTVDDYFSDPHDAQGNYPDQTVKGRKDKADAFRADLK